MLACPRCRETYPDDLAECPADGSTLLPAGMLGSVDAPLERGAMVGEFRVDRKLGAGTFGEVYAGEQPLIGKRVAIKLLHRKLSSDPEVVSRFVAEARAVNRIRHKNIIDIFSFGLLDESRHYFVMELLEGMTLRELLDEEERLPIEKALPIFRGIASGLDAAHEAGITHRDLKPDNVFLAIERDGSLFPKLLDFGIAKLLGEDVAHRTATGTAMGTPRYMSPEQCRGKKIDHRADIYSLGVLVHEALTGRALFDAESAMDFLYLHMTEPPRPMSSVCPDLPPELDEPVLAMLAKRPADRPASAGAAIEALAARAREHHGTAATLPVSSASPRTAAGGGAPLSAGAPTVQIRQRSPGSPQPPAEPPRSGAPTDRDAPGGAGPARASQVPATGDAAAVTEVALSSAGTGTLRGAPPVAAVANTAGATLRSSGASSLDVPPAPAARAAPSSVPVFWAAVALAVTAAAGTAVLLSRSGSSPDAIPDRTAEVPSAPVSVAPAGHAPDPAPSAPGAITPVVPDPPEAPASAPAPASASTPPSAAARSERPSLPPGGKPPSAPTGKPVAPSKVPDDLEPPVLPPVPTK